QPRLVGESRNGTEAIPYSGMTFDLDDTIAAIAMAAGGGLRGIIRLSGPKAAVIAGQLFEEAATEQPLDLRPNSLPDGEGRAARHRVPTCRRRRIRLPRELGLLPVTLYLWPMASSYTRQPSAELHLPGSPPVLEAA